MSRNRKKFIRKVIAVLYIYCTPKGRRTIQYMGNTAKKDCNIVWMAGGLGNQVFQYIFSRWLEETTKVNCLLDDSWFADHKSHNGYELEYVFSNIKVPIKISDFLPLGNPPVDIGPIRKFMIRNIRRSVRQMLNSDYDSVALPERTNRVYYEGYCVTSRFFYDYRDMFYRELAFKPISDPLNMQHEQHIRQSYSIGVHIRRGDFIAHGKVSSVEYYTKFIKKASSHAPDGKAVFFVFSDDIEWCRTFAGALGLPDDTTVFIDNNYDNKNNYIDMQLMSMCNALIVSPESTFSALAALLNREKGFVVINSEDCAVSLQT